MTAWSGSQDVQRLKAYCARVGANPLLTQGAGGNASWKEGNILWVKASGTWLEDALKKEIFVPVRYDHLQRSIQKLDFDVIPSLVGGGQLRPSIETLLHALMPHRVVVHLHAVDVLAYLVRKNCEEIFRQQMLGLPPWVMVDYRKPGKPLAQAVFEAIHQNPNVKVVFMKNHGLVVGGSDVEEVEVLVNTTLQKLALPPMSVRVEKEQKAHIDRLGFLVPVVDAELNALATDPGLFGRLKINWALTPDHVVFLGPSASIYKGTEDILLTLERGAVAPKIAFIQDVGVFISPNLNRAQQAQLRCYYDVLVRQGTDDEISVLSDSQVDELIHWDAENYRRELIR